VAWEYRPVIHDIVGMHSLKDLSKIYGPTVALCLQLNSRIRFVHLTLRHSGLCVDLSLSFD